MNKAKNTGMNTASLISMAIAVGVANSVALKDPVVGFGIAIAVFGIILLAQNLRHQMQR